MIGNVRQKRFMHFDFIAQILLEFLLALQAIAFPEVWHYIYIVLQWLTHIYVFKSAQAKHAASKAAQIRCRSVAGNVSVWLSFVLTRDEYILVQSIFVSFAEHRGSVASDCAIATMAAIMRMINNLTISF